MCTAEILAATSQAGYRKTIERARSSTSAEDAEKVLYSVTSRLKRRMVQITSAFSLNNAQW
jgi:hypothetical protein